MESSKFKDIRAKLNKTQKELAKLLGISIKSVHSYEQGWRKIPHHVERQLLFILFRVALSRGKKPDKCWDIQKCPEKKLEKCPVWEFKAGDLCWFINGTICNDKTHNSWEEKMIGCKVCKVFKKIFDF